MIKKTKNKKIKYYPSIIFLTISVIALAAAVILIQKPQDTRSEAASSCSGKCNIVPSSCVFYWGPVKITIASCFRSFQVKCNLECKSITPTPTPTRRPTSTPRPTPITCKSSGGVCIRMTRNQFICPAGYHDIGRFGIDCNYKSRSCCMPN